jgi:hypothetical protein
MELQLPADPTRVARCTEVRKRSRERVMKSPKTIRCVQSTSGDFIRRGQLSNRDPWRPCSNQWLKPAVGAESDETHLAVGPDSPTQRAP